MVQSNTGLLFTRVRARTGVTTQVDLGGASLTNGDGLLRRGRTLYVVRNRLNQIAVVALGRAYRSGTSPARSPTRTSRCRPRSRAFGPFLYAVNARFGTPPTPETTYTGRVRVLARGPGR